MTKKDYVIIARSLATSVEKSGSDLKTLNDVIFQVSLDLSRDNPKFNSELFIREIYWYAHELSFSLYGDRKEPRVNNILAPQKSR